MDYLQSLYADRVLIRKTRWRVLLYLYVIPRITMGAGATFSKPCKYYEYYEYYEYAHP